METTTIASKKKIIEWVNELEDKSLLNKITQLMNESKPKHYYTDEEAREISKEKIAHWQKTGISGEELKKRVFQHIDSLPWKK